MVTCTQKKKGGNKIYLSADIENIWTISVCRLVFGQDQGKEQTLLSYLQLEGRVKG